MKATNGLVRPLSIPETSALRSDTTMIEARAIYSSRCVTGITDLRFMPRDPQLGTRIILAIGNNSRGRPVRSMLRHTQANKLRRIKMLRPVITASVLGAAVGSLLAASVLFARADGPTSMVAIDNFSFGPQTLTVRAGTTVTWTNRDDIPHGIASSNNA